MARGAACPELAAEPRLSWTTRGRQKDEHINLLPPIHSIERQLVLLR